MNLTRRSLMMSGLAAALPLAANSGGAKFSVFSKHLQWLDWKGAGEAAKLMGFEGVDLTVRKGGHVLPERVKEDLPKAAAALRQAGVELTMITTDIADASTPYAEDVLATMKSLGVRHYRFGGLKYKLDKPLPEQVKVFRERLKGLVDLNAKYGTCAMYHTHSGVGQVGASMWDLWLIVRDYDPKLVGFNYDIGHATAEGGYGGWIHSFKLAAPYMRGVALKDYTWAKVKDEWRPAWQPIGEGMVSWGKFFAMLKDSGFDGPLQVHYEYKLGGAESGQSKITMERGQVLGMMKKDLDALRGMVKL